MAIGKTNSTSVTKKLYYGVVSGTVKTFDMRKENCIIVQYVQSDSGTGNRRLGSSCVIWFGGMTAGRTVNLGDTLLLTVQAVTGTEIRIQFNAVLNYYVDFMERA